MPPRSTFSLSCAGACDLNLGVGIDFHGSGFLRTGTFGDHADPEATKCRKKTAIKVLELIHRKITELETLPVCRDS